MTLGEAIRIIEEDIRWEGKGLVPGIRQAERLGIEALERLKDLRGHEPVTLTTTWEKIYRLLPSEDEK